MCSVSWIWCHLIDCLLYVCSGSLRNTYMFLIHVVSKLSVLLLERFSLCRHFCLTWWEERVRQSALYIGTRRSLSTTQRTMSIPQSPSSTTITDLIPPSRSNPSQKTTEQVSCFTRACWQYIEKFRQDHGGREPESYLVHV